MRIVAASEEQKRSRDLLTHAAWGQRISAEAFGRRELRLRAHPWCLGAMQSWLWVGGKGEVLASCETFRMRSVLRAGGRQRESVSFGIASVFTEPALRGRGHALAMMRALNEELRRLEPEAHGALLFSEVGATIYERAGYEPRSCHDRIFAAANIVAPPGASWIAEGEVAAALERFRLPGGFVIWPGAPQIDWHLERARIYAAELGRSLPSVCGVEIGGARALWSADFKNDRLALLLAEAPDAAASLALVEVARGVAAAVELAEVRIWETPSLPLPGGAGRRVPRDDDALPMLRAFDEAVRVEDWLEIPRALWV